MKKIISLALVFLFFFNINVQAKDIIYKTYYLENTEDEKMIYRIHKFIGEFTNEEKLFCLIKDFLGDNKEILKGIFIENGNLYVNFNNGILNGTKGSYGEITLIRTFLYTVFQFDNIKTVTFLNEGKYFLMPAGSYIYKYTREDLEYLDSNFILK